MNRRKVFSRFGGRCAYCGEALDFDNFHVDYIVPRIKGGKDKNNVFPSCVDCNLFKSSDDLEVFRERVENIATLTIHTRMMNKYQGVEKRRVVFFFERYTDGDL